MKQDKFKIKNGKIVYTFVRYTARYIHARNNLGQSVYLPLDKIEIEWIPNEN